MNEQLANKVEGGHNGIIKRKNVFINSIISRRGYYDKGKSKEEDKEAEEVNEEEDLQEQLGRPNRF